MFLSKKNWQSLISVEPAVRQPFYLIGLLFVFFSSKTVCIYVAEAEQENHISNVNNNICLSLVRFYIAIFFLAAIFHLVTNESDTQIYIYIAIGVCIFFLSIYQFQVERCQCTLRIITKNADKMTKHKHD